MTEKAEINNFDILKRMSLDNRDIRMAPAGNIVQMRKTKAGTQITIGVAGDVIGAIYSGQLTACMMLWDPKQFVETKEKMEAESEV